MRAISSDPQTVPLKALSDQEYIYQRFCFFKLFILVCGFANGTFAHSLLLRWNGELFLRQTPGCKDIGTRNSYFFGKYSVFLYRSMTNTDTILYVLILRQILLIAYGKFNFFFSRTF